VLEGVRNLRELGKNLETGIADDIERKGRYSRRTCDSE
jgi:hypothetical protein